jgi:imidazolonepropionase-like amidohydrolase
MKFPFRVFLTVVTMTTLSSGATAQTVIRATRMLDVETGSIIRNPVILIEGDRIVSLGGRPPRAADVIDLGDVTLIPGLIDLHTHILGDLSGDFVGRAVREGDTDAVLRGAKNARITLDAGFTTIRDIGGFAGVSLSRAIDRGDVPGPRIIPAANALGITGGHCDATGFRPGLLEPGFEDGVADGIEGVLRATRYQIKHGAKFIKICATAGVLSFEESVGAQQMTFEEIRTGVEEAARHGLHVAAHAHGTEGIMAAVRAGVRTIEHGSVLTDEAIALMIERGTYLVPTTYLVGAIDMDNLPPPIRAKADAIMDIAIASVRRAVASGVPIAFGTDAGVYPHGDNAGEFVALVDRGMTSLAAIQSGTVVAAQVLGVEDRGVLAPGRLADIIAVPGNPLNDITAMQRVSFVMKGGQVIRR